MLKIIVRYGLIAGVIVATPMIWSMARMPADARVEAMGGYLRGYVIMLVALSMVFLGIRHYRDRVQGGVIKFGRAFLVGLGISTVASVLYVIGWEVASAISDFDFAQAWSNSMIEAARAGSGGPADVERATAEAADFVRLYSNPMFRLPMVFIEIFPVGIVVSLISAAILRKPLTTKTVASESSDTPNGVS